MTDRLPECPHVEDEHGCISGFGRKCECLCHEQAAYKQERLTGLHMSHAERACPCVDPDDCTCSCWQHYEMRVLSAPVVEDLSASGHGFGP